MKAKVIKTGEMVDVYHEPQHGQITNIYKESVLVNGRMWTEDELNFSVETSEAPQQYIKKSALVAEIEKIYNEDYKFLSSDIADNVQNFKDDLLMNLDTLEVKEVGVDLDFQRFAKEMDAIFALPSSETENTEEEPLNWEYAIAKHFFELGLSVSNKQIEEKKNIDSLEEKCNTIYKDITMIGKDGNTINAKIEQREKV